MAYAAPGAAGPCLLAVCTAADSAISLNTSLGANIVRIEHVHTVCATCLLLCSGVWFPMEVTMHDMLGVTKHEVRSVAL